MTSDTVTQRPQTKPPEKPLMRLPPLEERSISTPSELKPLLHACMLPMDGSIPPSITSSVILATALPSLLHNPKGRGIIYLQGGEI